MVGGGPPARLLVVDDEATVTDLLQEFLTTLGYEVEVAASGEAAVARIPVYRPDAVLSDLNMAGLTGLDVMRSARQADEETMVILITGETTTAVAIDAMRQGAYDYIIKPFELDDVQSSVERALANRRLRAINRQLVEELSEKNEILSHHEQELREQIRLATCQMRTLYEVGKEISADLELAPRVATVAAKAAELSGARAVAVYLRVEETEECRVAAVHGLEAPHGETERVHFFAAERAIGFDHPDYRPVCRVAAAEQPIELPLLGGQRFESLLALPLSLSADQQVFGLLVMLDKPGGFSLADEKFLELYASQAAIAVHNSRLYEHTRVLDRLKSEFVAVVSHEIRTPLTSVKGAVELLTDDRYFQNNEQQAKLLSIAHANAERLLVLINDILDFSKLESSSLPMCMEVESLEPVVRQAVQNLRTLIAERHIVLDWRLRARSARPAHGLESHRAGDHQPAVERHQVLAARRAHRGAGRDGGTRCCGWACATAARASRPRTSPSSSASSPRSTAAPRARWEARGWAWSSARASWSSTAAASGSRACRARAAPSTSSCRGPTRRGRERTTRARAPGRTPPEQGVGAVHAGQGDGHGPEGGEEPRARPRARAGSATVPERPFQAANEACGRTRRMP